MPFKGQVRKSLWSNPSSYARVIQNRWLIKGNGKAKVNVLKCQGNSSWGLCSLFIYVCLLPFHLNPMSDRISLATGKLHGFKSQQRTWVWICVGWGCSSAYFQSHFVVRMLEFWAHCYIICMMRLLRNVLQPEPWQWMLLMLPRAKTHHNWANLKHGLWFTPVSIIQFQHCWVNYLQRHRWTLTKIRIFFSKT